MTDDIGERIIRSATLENLADRDGVVDRVGLAGLYFRLSARNIITGFVSVAENGRAMQARQAGIYNATQEDAWKRTVEEVRQTTGDGRRFIMQLAHAGRQTTRPGAVGASSRRCSYFRTPVRELATAEVSRVVDDFAAAAWRARACGFDGVQVHGAHGYLIHQFLSPWTNRRRDVYAEPTRFLREVCAAIRGRCGRDFRLWVKLGAGDERGMGPNDLIAAARSVEDLVDLVEVSYGSMEYAMNIFRGRCPVDLALEVNPLFNRYPGWTRTLWKKFVAPRYLRRFQPFRPNYNLEAALELKARISVPVAVVGGVRSSRDIQAILGKGIDYISLCRPFIREPDLVDKIRSGDWRSRCCNCNECAVRCDTLSSLQCARL